MTIFVVINKFWQEYVKATPKKIKIIDSYLLYIFITGIYQFIYCCLVGTFPFNSFLSGFVSSVSCFVLAELQSIIKKKEKCFYPKTIERDDYFKYTYKQSKNQLMNYSYEINNFVFTENFYFIRNYTLVNDKGYGKICLRLQVNPVNLNCFNGIGPERGFADFLFAHVILHLIIMNFIG